MTDPEETTGAATDADGVAVPASDPGGNAFGPASPSISPDSSDAAAAPARRARIKATRQRAQTYIEGALGISAPVTVTVNTIERQRAIGGSLLAGALAYRFFLVMLPLTLVVVSVLGFVSASSAQGPDEVAEQIGASGIFAQALKTSSADAQSGRWWTLFTGIFLLLWACYSLARSLGIVHALAWAMKPGKLQRPVVATLATLGLVVALIIISGGEARFAGEQPGVRIVATMVNFIVTGALWLGVSSLLPNRATSWTGLLPGALLFAVGVKAVHVFTIYYVVPHIERSSQLYGSLASAAGILLSLWVTGVIIVIGASLNGAVWDWRQRDVDVDVNPTEA